MISKIIKLISTPFLFFLLNESKAQDCIVGIESLKGKYDGGCNKGKAEGKGKATGKDTYEGEFKSGMPNGNGIYTWQNGNTYNGEWYKGMREGQGAMMYKLANKDSLVNGFWKKDNYTGKYEKPYIIHKRTEHISNVTIRKVNNTLNRIDFFLESESGGLPEFAGREVPAKPELTDINIQVGTYGKKTENASFAKKISYVFEEVEFPFKATFTMGNDMVELEILEAGRWTIEVRLHL
jgi:hypothetical protein